MESVFKTQEIKLESPYHPFEHNKKVEERLKRVKEEGIYIFGGKLENGKVINKL